jgi:hypothetical protein
MSNLGVDRLQGNLLIGLDNPTIDPPLKLVQLGVVDQHVWHCSFVDNLTFVFQFFNRARICRQTSRLLDIVDIQLVKDVAILRQLGEIIVVPGEISVARVVVCEESEPDLDCCSANSEAVAELSVHLFDPFGSTWSEDDAA